MRMFVLGDDSRACGLICGLRSREPRATVGSEKEMSDSIFALMLRLEFGEVQSSMGAGQHDAG